MIESITFRNLLSIRGEQTISFAASKDDTKEKDNVVKMNGGTRLLRAAFLYGNNDTGKSNVTKLIENFVKLMTLAPTDRKEIEVKPFKFEAVNKNLASMVSITFYIGKEKYVLVAEFDNDKFHTEKLLYYHSRKPFKLLSRDYKKYSKDSDGSLYSGEQVFEVGNIPGLSQKDKNAILAHVQDNCSMLAAYGKSNVQCEWLQRIYDYFSNRFPDRFTSVKTMTEYARNLLLNDPKGKAKRFLEHLLVLGGFVKCRLSVKTIDNAPRIVFTYRKFGLTVDIPENDEAKGKLRFLGMSSWLYRQIESPTFVMLDGIDKELHPDIRAFFYHAFLHNCQKESQLLFTTHSFYLLDQGFIRRDILWETKMGNHFDTILTPMKDFRIPKGNSLTNAYKQGKVGEHPKIGDFRLNLKKFGFKVKEEKKESSENLEKNNA